MGCLVGVLRGDLDRGRRLALGAPQGDTETDEGDAFRHGHRSVERGGQEGQGSGRDGGDGQQDCRPAGQDVGAEQGDAEDEAAQQVAGAGEVEEGLQVADVAGRVPAS